jgi:hypothetical protein
MTKALHYLSFFALLLVSCKTIKPVGPSLPPSQIDSKPLPESKIKAPISVNLEKTFQDLDNSLQRDFGDERNVNGSLKYSWYISRRPINPSLNADGSLDLTDNARWGVEVKTKNPINGQWFHLCGCDADASIVLKAKFGLNNDYALSGHLSKQSFNLSPCNVCAINFNVAPIALGIANPLIDQNLATFNQKINQYNFRNKFEPVWNNLFKNINITGVGYLTINPMAIELGNISGSGKTLHFEAGLMAKPQISLTSPPEPSIPPLPNLSSISGSGFSVYADLLLQYAELSTILKKNLNGKKIDYSKKGYVLIKDIDVFGQENERLIVKITFKAKYGWLTYRGNLYFTCLPKYDAQNKTLYVSEINFDPKTEQKLKDKGAAWILNSALKLFLGSEVKFSVDKQLNDLKDNLTKGINRQLDDHMALTGNVATLDIAGIFCASQYLQLRAISIGNLEITIN